MRAYVPELLDEKSGIFLHGLDYDRERRQLASGKDMFAHPVMSSQVTVEAVVGDHDYLVRHDSLRFEERFAFFEERPEVFDADRLEHLDRYNPVEASLYVTVVPKKDRDTVVHADFFHERSHVLVLFLGHRYRGYTATG